MRSVHVKKGLALPDRNSSFRASGWTLGQVAHQHHPPESTSAYIKVLEDPGHDEWQKPEDVVAHLELKPRETVADIGAGSGYFTVRLARAVALTERYTRSILIRGC